MNYTIVKSQKQYKEYCERVFQLSSLKSTKKIEDEIELVELLIEKWENEHYQSPEMDPIQLLRSMMENKKMKSQDLVTLLKISKGAVSQIMNYKKGLSKDVIRKLSVHFKLNQEAFNRPYKLKLRKKLVKKMQLA